MRIEGLGGTSWGVFCVGLAAMSLFVGLGMKGSNDVFGGAG